MKSEYIRKFIKENKWIITASAFFIIWKFFLIGTLWNDRLSPPEPDDSYIYIGYINSVKICPEILCNYPNISFSSYTGFTYLSYRLFFGLISKITNTDPELVFHLSFYFGTIFILPILIFFLKTFTENKKMIAFSLFFLALYNGSGSYHGFFWVVPSFFTLGLFLLIFSIINNNLKHWIIYLTIIIPTFIYLHPVSAYSIFIFPLFYIIYYFLSKKFDKQIFKKILFLMVFSILSYIPMYYHLHKSMSKNPSSIENAIPNITKILWNNQDKLLQPSFDKNIIDIKKEPATIFPGFKEIKDGYLLWIFPSWIGIFPFLISIFLVIYYKKYRLIALYFSLFLFMLVSSLNEYGNRFLLFIWPITFILYGFGFWYSYRLVRDRFVNKKKFYMLTSILLIIFISINITFSFFLAQYMNIEKNLNVQNEFTKYLDNNTSEENSIAFDSKIFHSFSLTTNLIKKNTEVSSGLSEKYLVCSNLNFEKNKTNLDIFFDVSSNIFKIPREKKNNLDSINCINNNFSLDKKFDLVTIYKNNDY